MKEHPYFQRISDATLKFHLESCGAVLIKGPKWCGKSTTAEQQKKSVVYMQDKEHQAQNIELAKSSPSLFLAGDTPRLIDEWQIIPFIWDSIRFEIDKRKEFGQFILTGSSVPPDSDAYEHSGAGRIVHMVMRTMSLYEAHDSSGKISLANLFRGEGNEAAVCEKTLSDYAYFTCRGGWPTAVTARNERVALAQVKNYYDVLVNGDLQRLGKIRRNPSKIQSLLRAYARNTASEASNTTLKEDMRNHQDPALDEDTIASYVNDLEMLYVVEELPAWNPNLRSKTAVRSLSTRHFTDPSIACAALHLSPMDLIHDLKTFGLLFESLAVHDLRIYAESLNGEVYHYRDASGLEADAIIKLENGDWAAVEVKLSNPERIEEGALHLLKLKSIIDTDKMKPPKFLMVLTATEYAYQRKDGVWVVPLGCLKP